MTDEEQNSLLNILSDEHTRNILQETMKEPMSADELSEACDISPQSVYRRTDPLTEHGLLDARMEYDADGHHYRTYTADPTQIVVEITAEDINVAISQQERMTDRFIEFVNHVRNQ
ncbi:ArsR/SmtB family transcription factor [Halostagnicola kamekurae]|uniref:Helix-turn-helix domain-containing protein n=1 Tax=Halostagnicola kamekurae TaxID=619731 RepID=A0A1I6RQL5_9EURY|nr:winged helix-turn-helix domain-containing protein [Halostagnicola kamekurae]SFS66926.1 Helix-turn-helix domain-containing protein [Halostagnicola kamekurae]